MGKSTNRLLNKRYCESVERGAGYLQTIVGLDCIYANDILNIYTTDEITNGIRSALSDMEGDGIEFYLNKINIELYEGSTVPSKITTHLVPIKAKDIPIYIMEDDANKPTGFVIGLTEDEVKKFGVLLLEYRFQGIGIKIPTDDLKYGVRHYRLIRDVPIYLVVANNRSRIKIDSTDFDIEYMPTCYIVKNIDY